MTFGQKREARNVRIYCLKSPPFAEAKAYSTHCTYLEVVVGTTTPAALNRGKPLGKKLHFLPR